MFLSKELARQYNDAITDEYLKILIANLHVVSARDWCLREIEKEQYIFLAYVRDSEWQNIEFALPLGKIFAEKRDVINYINGCIRGYMPIDTIKRKKVDSIFDKT